MSAHNFVPFTAFDAANVTFAMGADRQGKPTIQMYYATGDVAIVTPAAVTNWPRCTGDGNFGTMWGPTDVTKAKFTLDLTDAAINGAANTHFAEYSAILEQIDDKLLEFVHNNQLKVLGRKNLTREEVKMLQIRSVRPKYDKHTGALIGYTVQMSSAKYAYDGLGGKFARVINVCDCTGAVVPNGVVSPGDVVAATSYANQVYTGVGGDKFGIHWSMDDVQVVCQRMKLAQKTEVPVFGATVYDFASPYMDVGAGADSTADVSAQFSEPVLAH